MRSAIIAHSQNHSDEMLDIVAEAVKRLA
jgi:hypothetical protein